MPGQTARRSVFELGASLELGVWSFLPGISASKKLRCAHPTRFATLHIDNFLPAGHSHAMAKPALGRGLGALLGGSLPTAKAPPAPVLATPQAADSPVVNARVGVERV